MKKYSAYLLRIWSGDEAENPVWHASLEDPHTREILTFDSLENLCGYLIDLKSSHKNYDQAFPESRSSNENLPTR